ncbi:hypothetical protein OIU76_021231 [Salix suchowensis]|nr:hypothetical protein OIU76_021231 [Salix suchowensis]
MLMKKKIFWRYLFNNEKDGKTYPLYYRGTTSSDISTVAGSSLYRTINCARIGILKHLVLYGVLCLCIIRSYSLQGAVGYQRQQIFISFLHDTLKLVEEDLNGQLNGHVRAGQLPIRLILLL